MINSGYPTLTISSTFTQSQSKIRYFTKASSSVRI